MRRVLLITIILSIGIMATGIMVTGFGQGPFDSPGILSAEGEHVVLGWDGLPPGPPEIHSRGQIMVISPPGNNGSSPGAGLISPRNTSGALTGPPYHVFQTPQDVVPGQVLWEGLDVTYTQGTGNQATMVQRDVV